MVAAAPPTPPTARSRVRLSDFADRSVRIRGSYDAAQTTSENTAHWGPADSLSANAAHDPQVRRILVARSRYEFANNTYCRGMLLTQANDVVGTGPTLQLLGLSDQVADIVERKFMRWCRRIRLAEKLRAIRIARARDGEVFVMRTTNMGLGHPVKLDLKLIETDMVTTPDLTLFRDNQLTDGIVFDTNGNPQFYHILKQHPGETLFMGGRFLPHQYDTIAAANVRHFFRLERPGQTRGVPEITPALPLFAQLRRYTLAVIAAAETAAEIAGVIQSTFPAQTPEEMAALQAMDLVELVRRSLLVMPEGWAMNQYKAEQPTTTYAMFKAEIINEIARCLNMPYNVAACNSSSYNYASGQLDHQVYDRNNDIDRDDLDLVIMDWAWDSWLHEAVRIPGYLPTQDFSDVDIEFFWMGREHADPVKNAKAVTENLANRTTTLAHEFSRKGRDWRKALVQRSIEVKTQRDLGIGDGESALTSELGKQAEIYGIAVRAGLITPNVEDENHFRTGLGLPKVSEEVRTFWERQKGVRLPVTLRDEREIVAPPPTDANQPDMRKPSAAMGKRAADDDDDDKEDDE